MNLFGKAKPKSTPKDAIVKLRDTLETLEKREKFLQTKIDNEIAVAKCHQEQTRYASQTDPTVCAGLTLYRLVAIMALKRKKNYENEIKKLEGARMTLEAQMLNIESANTNLSVLESMKEGANAMKSIHGKM